MEAFQPDQLMPARVALETAKRRLFDLRRKTDSRHPVGSRADIAAAAERAAKAQTLVDELTGRMVAELAARAATHTPGAVPLRDETTAQTLARWAWEDLHLAETTGFCPPDAQTLAIFTRGGVEPAQRITEATPALVEGRQS